MARFTRRYPGRLSRLSFFTRMEMAELPKLLMPNERVLGVISGVSQAGTVLMAVTSNRLLIIDKKWIRISYEDIRYESINEVRYAQQAIFASARFYIMGRDLLFKSWYKNELRTIVEFIQDKMFELRPAGSRMNGDRLAYDSGDSIHGGSHSVGYHREPRFSNPKLNYQKPITENYLTYSSVPQHVMSRVERWQRAARFVSELPGA